MSDREPTTKELFDLVRKGMVWRGTPLKDNIDEFTSIRMWLVEADITAGIRLVRATAMYDTYLIWCKERKLDKKSILSMVRFCRFFKNDGRFHGVNKDHIQLYYINKELHEDQEAKKKRQETHRKRTATKKAKKEKEAMGFGTPDLQ